MLGVLILCLFVEMPSVCAQEMNQRTTEWYSIEIPFNWITHADENPEVRSMFPRATSIGTQLFRDFISAPQSDEHETMMSLTIQTYEREPEILGTLKEIFKEHTLHPYQKNEFDGFYLNREQSVHDQVSGNDVKFYKKNWLIVSDSFLFHLEYSTGDKKQFESNLALVQEIVGSLNLLE